MEQCQASQSRMEQDRESQSTMESYRPHGAASDINRALWPSRGGTYLGGLVTGVTYQDEVASNDSSSVHRWPNVEST